MCYAFTNKSIEKDLTYILAVSTGGDMVPIDSNTPTSDIRLAVATNSITLHSGESMVVYIAQPDSITLNDIGLTAAVTVFTSQAMYYQEANVQAFTS